MTHSSQAPAPTAEAKGPGTGNAGWLARYTDAVMNTFGTPGRVLVRGRGAHVWDADGQEYIDLLAGIAVTQGFSALTSFIIMVGADANTTRGVLYWLMGSFASVSWTDVALSATVLAGFLLLTMFMAGSLDAFMFGEQEAATLGVSVHATRIILLGGAALMTAVVVSSSGAIGFVGLVLPHIARLLVGSRHRALLPVSAVFGAIFLLWADTIARAAFAPLEVPVGVITALVGVPIFATILARTRKR